MKKPGVLRGVGLPLLLLVLGGCGGGDTPSDSSATGATATEIPASPSPTPEARGIPASDPSIVAGDHEFAVVAAGIVPELGFGSGLGFVPVDFQDGETVLVVEFQLVSGDPDGFAALKPLVIDGDGGESGPFVVIVDGVMSNTDVDIAMVGSDVNYQSDPNSTHVWAFSVPGSSTDDLQILFPSGELVDLVPVMN